MLKCREHVWAGAVHPVVLEPGAFAIEYLGVREPSTPVQEPGLRLCAKRVRIHIVLGEDLPEEYANLQEAHHLLHTPPTQHFS